jgi:pyruvate,water dikinase
MAGEVGRRFASAAAIAAANDVYWLEASEVDSLAAMLDAGSPLPDYAGVVAERKVRWQTLRRASPPVTIPQKSWMNRLLIHENAVGAPVIKGIGASAGRVTAPACVILGPEDFYKMKPGSVLVTVTTTPAWTPLFTLAAAVVTDIGGPLSHSSIVAREYGIPAVLATGVASRRIQDGQMITVDGSAGTIQLN